MQGDDPGLAVARIALGCGNFGGVGSAPAFFGQGLTEDQAFALMDAAWAAGRGDCQGYVSVPKPGSRGREIRTYGAGKL